MRSTAPASSAVETSGFASPPVVSSDTFRVPTVRACTVPAIPPPAISARVHFSIGSSPVTTDAVMTIPATTAAGVARTSSRWSSHGM